MISKLFVDQSVVHSPFVKDFQKSLNLFPEIITDSDAVFKNIIESNDPVSDGKKQIILTSNKGKFIKKCPGTTEYTCCNYKILHVASYCHMDCSYCILQVYFHPPVLQYFLNIEDLDCELDQLFSSKEITRIGTGEFSDSLIWNFWNDQTKWLIEKFSGQTTAVLELKTKSTAIKKILDIHHNRKTILSWSLNTERIIKCDERNTASLESRLNAAKESIKYGYPVAFHFDPIVIYDGCVAEYENVIRRLFSTVNPESVVYISLGSFRFIPSLKKIILKRFPESDIVYGEFIMGLDGKMRYFKPLRIKIYKEIIRAIKAMAPDVFIYFCMEDSEVWEKTMGFHPADTDELGRMLDQCVIKHCNLKTEC